MGLEFSHQHPRAATHIAMTQFPGLQQLSPEVATESLMQLANAFRGDFDKRQGWGWHDREAWRLFLKTSKHIKQIAVDISADDDVYNDYVAAANNFDKEKVKAAADAYDLPAACKNIDVEALRKRL
jgi:NitT/TauT family transport system substrate-binding protein